MKVVDEVISIMKLKIVFLRLDIFFPVFTNIVNGMGVKEDELILQS